MIESLRSVRLLTLLLSFLLVLAACGGESEQEELDCEAGTSGEDCAPCESGTFCAGGDAEPVGCAEGAWDDDGDPSTPCVARRDCEAGEFVSGQGSATEDRQCAACAEGTFSTQENAESCAAWSACAPGEFAATPGSAVEEPVCQACAEGTFSTEENAASCQAFTSCPAGQFVQTAGTATRDQSCGNCAAGTFSTEENAGSCETWQECAAGEYILGAGSSTENQVCATCEEGTYSESVNSSVCQPHGECAAGTRKTSPGSETEAPECEACEAGNYCAGGEAEPVACEEGRWDHDENPANQCLPWTDCLAGEFEVALGSTTEDRQCAECGLGFFSTTENASSCVAWTVCEAGEYVFASGSTTADRQCTECEEGSLSTTENASSCAAWTECLAGEYVSASGSATEDQQCTECEGGSFSGSVNASECAVWTDCGDDEIVVLEGTATMDRQCQSCPDGQTSEGPNAEICEEIKWHVVSGGDSHTCGVRGDGTLWCWGAAFSGQLGLGDTTLHSTPQQVLAGHNDLEAGWKSVSAGVQHTCAVRDDSTLWCWGSQQDGRLGNGVANFDLATTPQQILEGDQDLEEGWKSVDAGGGHTCAVRYDSTLWCWGTGSVGRLGLGDMLQRTTPTQVLAGNQELEEGWKNVSAGFQHTCAVREDSTLWCWGSQQNGRLGNGASSFGNIATPQQVLGGNQDLEEGWKSVTAGFQHTCAVREDSTLWCWGLSSRGQLGLGDGLSQHTTPQQVLAGQSLEEGWASVVAGQSHVCALREDRTLWCWGSGIRGEHGLGNTSNQDTPQLVFEDGDELNESWRSVIAGREHTCAVRADTTLWCWGMSASGQLGDGTVGGEKSLPTPLDSSLSFTQIDAGLHHGCAVAADTTLWCWGGNTTYQLGLGNFIRQTMPQQVLTDDIALSEGWESVSAGYAHTCAVREDSTLWCWGDGNSGRLGLGDTTLQITPQQVLAGNSALEEGWKSVTTGELYTCAVRDDSTMWCWGFGLLGLGSANSETHLTPQLLFAGDDDLEEGWASITAGQRHTCAIREDTTLWCWGAGSFGQLGLGNNDTAGTPLQVFEGDSALSEGWTSVEAGHLHTCGVRDDLTLWCWGENQSGHLGLGELVNHNTPQQVLAGDIDLEVGWTSVSAGHFHTCAMRDDLTSWCWGAGFRGQLGLGTSDQHETPQLVGSDWVSVSAGAEHTHGLRSDGTAYSWGSNSDLQLGDGSEWKVFPVQTEEP